MKLIDKDVLATKIENRIKETESIRSMVDPLKILDTIEVKKMDLDYIKKELDELIKIHKPNGDFGWGTLYNVATHFFELGLKVKK